MDRGTPLVVLGSGEPVERGPLLCRPQQPKLVGLSVYRDDLLTQLAQHRHRYRPAAQVGPRPALGGDRAGYRIAESEIRRLLEEGKEAA